MHSRKKTFFKILMLCTEIRSLVGQKLNNICSYILFYLVVGKNQMRKRLPIILFTDVFVRNNFFVHSSFGLFRYHFKPIVFGMMKLKKAPNCKSN